MKLNPFQLYLRTMIVGPGKLCYLSKEEAYMRLKKLARIDFGFDFEAWREWGRANPDISGIRRVECADTEGEDDNN